MKISHIFTSACTISPRSSAIITASSAPSARRLFIMDPLSIISGVAGVAAAGVALSSALYDLVASISNAPKEMVEIAQGIHDLSTVLRELRRGMRKSRKMLSGRLFRSVSSVMDRIRDIHDKVDQLLDAEGSLARLLWAFRKSKAMKLLAIIESHKSTVQLIAVTITLAVVQREHTEYVLSMLRYVL